MASLKPLSVKNLCKSFGGLAALQNVSLDLQARKIHALIGANGAGKTTLLELLCGLQKSDSGNIMCLGHDITHASAAARTRYALAYSAQIPLLFEGLSVTDNIALAVHNRRLDESVLESLWSLPLYDDRHKLARQLNHGHRKLLQLAMALATEPAVLILDEPTQALAETDIRLTKQLIRRYVKTGGAVLLVEHNMDVVSDLADKVTVLDFGSVLASGTVQAIKKSPKVRKAYLGGGHAKS